MMQDDKDKKLTPRDHAAALGNAPNWGKYMDEYRVLVMLKDKPLDMKTVQDRLLTDQSLKVSDARLMRIRKNLENDGLIDAHIPPRGEAGSQPVRYSLTEEGRNVIVRLRENVPEFTAHIEKPVSRRNILHHAAVTAGGAVAGWATGIGSLPGGMLGAAAGELSERRKETALHVEREERMRQQSSGAQDAHER